MKPLRCSKYTYFTCLFFNILVKCVTQFIHINNRAGQGSYDEAVQSLL